MRRYVLIALAFVSTASCAGAGGYVADGRATLPSLHSRYDSLRSGGGWLAETVYTYPDDHALAIESWRTKAEGPALWILAGIHGEEPAGPNALANGIGHVAALARAGLPMVFVPMCNPRAYFHNWRYPSTPDRNWQGGGYSVGDSEWLLPTVAGGTSPRAAKAPGPETQALTRYVLGLAGRYPPVLVLDFHEDELSAGGGYVYWQGRSKDGPAVAGEIVRLLRAAGVAIRAGGKTRFDETIDNGIIGPNGVGGLFNDGSVDELLAAPEVIVEGKRRAKPAAPVAIVIETPADAGSKLDARVAGHLAVIAQMRRLWEMSGGSP
jgi:hypothetical protein